MNSKYLDRWAELIVYQKEIAPFPVTLAEAARLWGYHASSDSNSPRVTLKRLVQNGYAIERKPFGRCSFYFAVDPMEKE